jgi:hypothetical protein
LPDKQNRGFSRFFTKGKEWTLGGLARFCVGLLILCGKWTTDQCRSQVSIELLGEPACVLFEVVPWVVQLLE